MLNKTYTDIAFTDFLHMMIDAVERRSLGHFQFRPENTDLYRYTLEDFKKVVVRFYINCGRPLYPEEMKTASLTLFGMFCREDYADQLISQEF
jgi:hypothetical protein